jgi:hypothetical protein
LAAVLIVVTVLAASCSSGGSTKHATATIATTTTSTSGPPTSGLPANPPAGLPAALPSPAPAKDGDLHVPAFPDVVTYEGQGDVRGQANFRLVAGRVSEGIPFYSPTILIGSSGERLTIMVVNQTPSTHNFSLDAENINQNIIAGATETVTVVFPTKGALVFYCKIHGAEGHGGELYVP